MAILATVPKYKQMKEILLERLRADEYPVESKFPSENVLLREFGVSKHTVLKALGELVNEGFLYRKQGAGTFVKPRQSKQLPGNHQIAMIHYASNEDTMSNQSMTVLRGVEQAISGDSSYSLQFCTTDCVAENEIKAINRLRDIVSGFLVLTIFREGQPHPTIDYLLDQKIPFVNILSDPNESYEKKINSFTGDDFQGGYIATQHLLEAHCETIYVLLPDQGKYALVNYQQRLAGVKQALADAGKPFDESKVIHMSVSDGPFNFEHAGYQAGELIVDRADSNKKFGVFTLASDRMAYGVLQKFRQIGVAIPAQAAICGYDNEAQSNEWANNLTTIDVDAKSIGFQASQTLIDTIKAGVSCHVPVQELIPNKLVVRGTTTL